MTTMLPHGTKEYQRLYEPFPGRMRPWQRWGPYISERAWGTVREDYSANGDAWHYFPHDLARSKAYRWGEDGLAGICDRYQVLVLALVLWNGQDPILKERLFGLVPSETNHGEDVKEYYFYLDATPTHSYMKYLYKYPQRAYPYRQLSEESRKRQMHEPEYELLDTGIFDDQRYFDVFVEYAKANPEDLCMRIEICNRGPEAAPIHVLPHLWFRNTWGWGAERLPQPWITLGPQGTGHVSLIADDSTMPPLPSLPFTYRLGPRYLYGAAGATPLFTDNETNGQRVWGEAVQSPGRWVKDAFHRHIIDGEDCVNPAQIGTKACLHYANLVVPVGGSVVVRLRLTDTPLARPLTDVDSIVATRREEADEFYATIHPPHATADECLVQRQALAGMLWSKQVYLFNVPLWRDGDNPHWPPPASRRDIRNRHWQHLNSMHLLSMPDKWEYPWFASWDLAFQCITLALVDAEFAKEQLWFLLCERLQHPNGQIPASEWEFSDFNPPVQTWAIWRVYNMDRMRSGKADRLFLERCFHKLLINFAWWVNTVDSEGNNVFEGGCLGLDTITVIDRSAKLPGGVTLKQSDATGWMGMFCLTMMRMALELARENKAYESLATQFFEHYVSISAAMKKMGSGGYERWCETDSFFYNALSYPDGNYARFRVRSLVGLIPLYAIECLEEKWLEPFTEFRSNLSWFLDNRQELMQRCVTTVRDANGETVHILAILTPEQLSKLLFCLWDPAEFRAEYGLRSLSKYHEVRPYVCGEHVVCYEPGEATVKIKGGNANWQGPLWFPTTFLMIESLRKLRKAYGSSFHIPSPVPGEGLVTLDDMARGFANRLITLFTRDAAGKRPMYNAMSLFQHDPYWRDCLLFYEYFHGEDGHGLGACHQTGWTGLVANLIDEWRQ